MHQSGSLRPGEPAVGWGSEMPTSYSLHPHLQQAATGLRPTASFNYYVSARALSKTSRNILSVSFPVEVFCWLGWYDPMSSGDPAIRYSQLCPNGYAARV